MVIVAIALPLISVLLKICGGMIKKLGVIAQYVMKEVFLTLVMYLAIGLGFMSGLHLNYERKYYAEYKDAVGGGEGGAVQINYFYGNLGVMLALTLIFSACVLALLGESEGFGEYRSVFKKEEKGAAMYLTVLISYRYLLGMLMSTLSEYADVNIVVLCASTLFLIYIIAVRPFKHKMHNVRCLVVQFSCVAVCIVHLAMAEAGQSRDIAKLGRDVGGGVTIWVFIGLAYIVSLVHMGMIVKAKWDKWKKQGKLRDYVYGDGDGEDRKPESRGDGNSIDQSQAAIMPAISV